MSLPSKEVSIMLTGDRWHVTANNTGHKPLSDKSADTLAKQIFGACPDVDVVSVLDGAGRLLRCIHRNLGA